MSTGIILVSVFLTVWLAAWGGWVLYQRWRPARNRLAALVEETGRAGNAAGAPPGFPRRRDLQASPAVRRLTRELQAADLQLRPQGFLALCALAVFLLGGAGYLLSGSIWIGAAAGGLGAAAPWTVVRVKQSQRRALFESQLPDALSLVTSSLRSGYSFLQALNTVAQEMPDPMGAEIRLVVEESRMGRSLEEALEGLQERVRSYDTHLLVTAINIQHQVGGNLAELLDTLAETIRERFRSRGEIAALTAEGRLSGLILFALPIGVGGFLLVTNPDYMSPLFEHPMGQTLLVIAILLQLTGGLVMRRLIAIDV